MSQDQIDFCICLAFAGGYLLGTVYNWRRSAR